MSSLKCQIRRATLDDIGQLTELWNSMKFSVEELSRHITEFQLAVNNEGIVLGAVGLQIMARQGLIHSEAFVDFSMADELRPLLWERLQAVANNHGLLRFWTLETAPFWSRCGLVIADPEALTRLPAWRGSSSSSSWLTLKLREDVDTLISVDKEFARFMEMEKQKTQRTFQQARLLKAIVLTIALGVFLLGLVGVFFLIRHNPNILHR